MRCIHCGKNTGSVVNREWNQRHHCGNSNCVRETWNCWAGTGGCDRTWTQWTCEG